MEKKFIFEVPKRKLESFGYKNQILAIINEVEERVRVVIPDERLHKELHESKIMDTRAEVRQFESVRKDICETFGVPFDEEHISIYDPHRTEQKLVKQRALRCFSVLSTYRHNKKRRVLWRRQNHSQYTSK